MTKEKPKRLASLARDEDVAVALEQPEAAIERDEADALPAPGLRPTSLAEFTGQTKLRENLMVYIQAATERKESLEHVLLCGPPGLGKTTLAAIIAREMRVGFRSTSGPVLERQGDLAAILTSLNDGDVLFIDEIHRMQRVIEESLYSAMEDFQMDIIIGEGPNARTLKLSLPKFTLIGATTKQGLLTSPLRDRFGIPFQMEFYSVDELSAIVKRSACLLGTSLSDAGASTIARRSRGTPRVANRLLKRIRDFAQVAGNTVIDTEIVDLALLALNIDACGLDENDHRFLHTIIDRFNGGPAGIEAIAAAMREDRETIEDVYEPYLLQEGYLERTARGRVATDRGYKHLGVARQPVAVSLL